MSIKFPVLLTFFCLLACHSHKAALLKSSNFLNENIRLLQDIIRMNVSCDEMNVTNIFADRKKEDEVEILCKAATVALEGQSCHRQLEGVSLNLRHLVRRTSTVFEAPCPVAAGNTTSLKDFLLDLNKVHQQLAKDNTI
ncbi:interleukin-4 [Dromaius novaehollandiae]|uniref:interleukin-4 n=1 Tax=Dromaius novaehollandiae TaxID=8790 RepID=UPI00311EF97E